MAPLGWYSFRKLAGVKPITYQRALQLADYATSMGGDIGVISGLRSYSQQEALYADSTARRAAGKDALPAAPPGTSAHETGDAFDIAFYRLPPGMMLADFQRRVADFSRTIGLKPGLDFRGEDGKPDPDPPHFENAVRDPVDVVAAGGGAIPAAMGQPVAGSPPPSTHSTGWLELDPGWAIAAFALLGTAILWWRRGP